MAGTQCPGIINQRNLIPNAYKKIFAVPKKIQKKYRIACACAQHPLPLLVLVV